jgi:Cof subfamily protein (haloacid dehalogenase superfamily)
MLTRERLRKLKLIVFDLDGTLLNDEREIGAETLQLVPELKKEGVFFSFASGRLHSALTKFAEQLNISTPLISLDGSLIKSFPKGDIVFHSYIPRKKVLKAIRLADRYLLKLALCHGDAIYYTEENSLIPDMIEKYGAKFREVESYRDYLDETLEIVIAGDYRETVKYVAGKLIFPYTFGLNTSYYKSHYHQGIYYIESRNAGISKGMGLKKLIKHMGLKWEETAVLGDWYNDRSLFETKAMKIAVANAVPEISRLADVVLKRTNNEDASAEFLEKVLSAKKRK